MKKKILKLVEKQGFIIFLFIGVCLVAGITLYISIRGLDVAETDFDGNELVILDEEESYSYDNGFDIGDLSDLEVGFAYSDDLTEEEIQDLEDSGETQEVSSMETEESEDKILEDTELAAIGEIEALEFEEDNYEEKAQDTYSPEEIGVAILPLDGEIITDYTEDSLIYSETLEAWVGHGAIDIKAKERTPVLSAMDGEVKRVYKDDLWGIVIIIDHGNGLEGKYSNLGTMEMVREGLKVEKGDHISIVGRTAKVEMHMQPHLHFEVRKNGKIIDPRSITK